MRYQDGTAFRRALEDRLNAHSRQTGLPLVRLRKLVAFERLLARLHAHNASLWLLKGGLALQWRYALPARTTRDLDLLLVCPVDDVHALLVRAALLELEDWFRFFVQSTPLSLRQEGQTMRFQITATMGGRPFEMLHLDIGLGDPVVEQPDILTGSDLLSFAEIAPVQFPTYPLTQHIAEKVHAYTRPHNTGAGSRVKDLADLALIGQSGAVSSEMLSRALQATFRVRATHALPECMPPPPPDWELPFTRLSTDMHLNLGLAEATLLLQAFLNPVLAGEALGIWNPSEQRWGTGVAK